MKRLALVIFLVTAIAASAFAVLNRPGAEASPDVTITVNSTADTHVRDGVLTLREAMLLARGDLTVGDLYHAECDQVSGAIWLPYPILDCFSSDPPGAAYADTIVFDSSVFPPGSPGTITLSFPLPPLTTGWDTVDGSSAGVVVDGADKDYCFGIASDDNVIKGLEIYYCSRAVLIEGGQGNIIGGSSSGEGNVISGNDYGVVIKGGEGNVVKGNHIGTNAAGTAAVPNGLGVVDGVGVRMQGGVQNNTVEGNVISGNDGAGVAMEGSGTNGNTVKGNYVGTNADGTAAIPNASGVSISGGAQNIIGGSTAGDRNVISGNDYDGVRIIGSGANGNTVKGNYIGTNADGTAAIPNASGVTIAHGAQNNSVGGSTAGEGNVISGNGTDGVTIWDDANGNTVEGNYIGTDASGTAALPNGWNGVNIWHGAQNNTVGGTAAGEGNTIAFNNQDGVQVDGAATTGNTIRGNSIHSNGGKGIANQGGGNLELEPPVITGFGSVMGTACPGCLIDVYSDQEDEGEGRMFLLPPVQADGFGDWVVPGYPIGPNVTGTATDADGNTSEFSLPFVCGSDSDGDTIGDACDPAPTEADGDADGFDDYVEAYIGTDPLDDCPDDLSDDACPPDITMDTVVDIFDALTFLAAFPSAEGMPNYSTRLDMAASDGVIDIFDALTFLAYFPSACTNP